MRKWLLLSGFLLLIVCILLLIYFKREESISLKRNFEIQDLREESFSVKKNFEIQDIKIEFIKSIESKIYEDGSFEYISNIDGSPTIDDYDILRHSLTYYALLKEYENNKELLSNKEKVIKKGIDFIIPRIVEKDNKAFVISDNMEDVELGDTCMAVLLMCEYQKNFNNFAYNDYIVKLANGILEMQRAEGKFNHLCTFEKLILKKENVIIYYEGEAVLSLCKAYEATKNEEYLKSAKKAMDYYISSGYEQYHDHWQEYAICELLKYYNEPKYINYAILNLCNKVDACRTQKMIYNTDLETLKTGLSIYEKNEDFEGRYSLKEVQDLYQKGLNSIVSSCNNLSGDKIVEGFFTSIGKKSIRIDDLAHYIMALP